MMKSARNEVAMRMTNRHANGMADRRPFWKRGRYEYIGILTSVRMTKRHFENVLHFLKLEQ